MLSAQHQQGRDAAGGPGNRSWFTIATAVASLAPLVIYFVLRPLVHSDVVALSIGGAVPVAMALVFAAIRRRSPWSALLIAAVFGLAIAATVLSGGDSLPLKIYRSIATGVFGLACVVSVAARRPLLAYLVRGMAKRDERVRQALARGGSDPAALHRRLTVLTLLVGAIGLVEAALTIVLALTLSTGSFLVVSRLARWGMAGLGIIAVLVYRYRVRKTQQPGGPAGAAVGNEASAGQDAPGGRDGSRSGLAAGLPHLGSGRLPWQLRIAVLAVIAALLAVKLIFNVHL
jgi:hypothetical protein